MPAAFARVANENHGLGRPAERQFRGVTFDDRPPSADCWDRLGIAVDHCLRDLATDPNARRWASRSVSGRPVQEAQPQEAQPQDHHVSHTTDPHTSDEIFAEQRRQMVERQLAARDITDRSVREAMLAVPRHLFVPERELDSAYVDGPLPIGHAQTISQPYIVALMTQLAHPTKSAVALDVGTGSGYQAAVLSLLCAHVYSVEIVESLADSARSALRGSAITT